jgi:DNA polymerase III sliding clamp (beta) subunit (PCNA family)
MENFRIIFRSYQQLMKKIRINLNNFLSSVDRVASVSTDQKEGVKFQLLKDILKLSVITLIVEMEVKL